MSAAIVAALGVSSRQITIAGFLLALGVAGCVELAARRGAQFRGRPLPTADDVLAFVMRNRTGRVIVMVAWCWLGWHFLAR
jgi:hypothetical protein